MIPCYVVAFNGQTDKEANVRGTQTQSNCLDGFIKIIEITMKTE